MFELDRSAEVPVGVQLAWILRAKIAAGELGSGDRLPGARELAEQAGVNANTVRSVYARLAEEGLIEIQHGRGTFVTSGAGDRGVADFVDLAVVQAKEAGLDPRALAAALYMHASFPDQSRPSDAAARRQLREEVAALEQRLARLEVPQSDDAAAPRRPAANGSRLLTAAELTSTRDELRERVARAEREDEELRAAAHERLAAEEPSHDTPSLAGTRASRQRWELSLGHGRWTIPLTES